MTLYNNQGINPRKRINNLKTITKITIDTYISIMTLNVNERNAPGKRQRMAE